MKKYSKALVACAGLCAVIGKVAADGSINALEVAELLGALGVAYGVYRVRNVPPVA